MIASTPVSPRAGLGRGLHPRVLCLALLCAAVLCLGDSVAGDDLPPRAGSGSAADLESLIADLGSDRFRERRAATQGIMAAGAEAIEAVAAAGTSADREVRIRSLAILKYFAGSTQRTERTAARVALQRLAEHSDAAVARAAVNALENLSHVAALTLEKAGARIIRREGRVVSINLAKRDITDEMLMPLLMLGEAKHLDLRYNPITNEGLEYLEEMAALETLNLRGTRVTDEGLSHLAHLTRLTSFSAESTPVTDAGLHHLRMFRNLETLYLGGSQVKGPGLEMLSELPITYLSLQDSAIDDSAARSIVQLKQLTTLGLDDTPVTDACLPTLLELKELKVLWLDSSQVTDAGLEHLAGHRGLQKLYLRKTSLTPQGHEKLKKLLPNTMVYYSAR